MPENDYGPVLTEDMDSEGEDYTLRTETDGVWITVDNVSVWVGRGPHGVKVELLARGAELALPVYDTAYMPFAEATRIRAEEEK